MTVVVVSSSKAFQTAYNLRQKFNRNKIAYMWGLSFFRVNLSATTGCKYLDRTHPHYLQPNHLHHHHNIIIVINLSVSSNCSNLLTESSVLHSSKLDFVIRRKCKWEFRFSNLGQNNGVTANIKTMSVMMMMMMMGCI